MKLNRKPILEELKNNKDKAKIKNILNNLIIKNIDDFKNFSAYSKKYLSSQEYSTIAENKLKQIFKLNNAINNLSRDAEKNKNNIEIKFSIESSKYSYNFVQLRPHHNLHFYLFSTYSYTDDNLNFYLLNSNDINDLIIKYGGYAHGGKNFGEIKTNFCNNLKTKEIEYALRPKINGKLYLELQEKNLLTNYNNNLNDIIIEFNNIIYKQKNS